MEILIVTLILLLASSAASSKPESPTPSSVDSTPTDPPTPDEYRLLYIKNAKPYVLSDHHSPLTPLPFHRRHRHHHHGRHRGGRRKKTKKAAGSTAAAAAAVKPVDAWPNRRRTSRHAVGPRPRPFYVMLPKGYVPPSGSSPCHNLYPTTGHDEHHFDCHFYPNNLKP